jgi:glycerol-3-phosphate dehydrogenase
LAEDRQFDVLVIGGGINGVGIARDIAGRGLSVLLCEKNDLGWATSSASTKLIHGGLRYLEYYEFRLVREALGEREVLLRAAPHIIWPLRFVLPHGKGLRPFWMIRIGLFLYDHLGGRELRPGSEGVDLRRDPTGNPLVPELTRGFVYSDCWVQDSRLVVLNAMDAADHGAEILPRTECLRARREGSTWHAALRDSVAGTERAVTARALVNATGPWVGAFLGEGLGIDHAATLRLVKGSHIVVPKMFDHEHAYIFQNPDRRIVFAIPYEGDYTLVGTTELDYDADLDDVHITEGETRYLCDAVNAYFERSIAPADVVWSYAGVRPLYGDDKQDSSAVTRDYVLDLDQRDGGAPLLNVFGGKITTYRKLAEQAVGKLARPLGITAGTWTASAPLPGGDIANADFEGFLAAFRAAHPWLPADLARRYARNYGTLAANLLGNAGDLAGLGEDLGDGLYEAEVDYLVRREWARTAEDILWRRSKLGLHVSKHTAERLAARLGGSHEISVRRASGS